MRPLLIGILVAGGVNALSAEPVDDGGHQPGDRHLEFSTTPKKQSTPEKTPYLVGGQQLKYTGPPLPKVSTGCTAVLLHPKWVLQAAHCEKGGIVHGDPCDADSNPTRSDWKTTDRCCMATGNQGVTRAKQVAGTAPLAKQACTNVCDTSSRPGFPPSCAAENPSYKAGGYSCPEWAGYGCGPAVKAACPICCAASTAPLPDGVCKQTCSTQLNCGELTAALVGKAEVAEIDHDKKDESACHASMSYTGYPRLPPYAVSGPDGTGWEYSINDLSLRELDTPYAPPSNCAAPDGAKHELQPMEFSLPDKCDDYRGWTWWMAGFGAQKRGGGYINRDIRYSQAAWKVDRKKNSPSFTFDSSKWGFTYKDDFSLDTDAITHASYDDAFVLAKDKGLTGAAAHKFAFEASVGREDEAIQAYDPASLTAGNKDGTNQGDSGSSLIGTPPGCTPWGTGVASDGTTCRSVTVGTLNGGEPGQTLLLKDKEHYNCPGASITRCDDSCPVHPAWGVLAKDGTFCDDERMPAGTPGAVCPPGTDCTDCAKVKPSMGAYTSTVTPKQQCEDNTKNAKYVDVGDLSSFGSVHKAKPWIVKTIGEGLKTRQCYGVGNKEWTKPLTTAGDRCYCSFHKDKEGLNACPSELCVKEKVRCMDEKSTKYCTGSNPKKKKCDWYDSDGPFYDCAWYGKGTNCARYGHNYANQGMTANDACCVCKEAKKKA